MTTVPGVVLPTTLLTVPADTVARLVLLEVHVAKSVMSATLSPQIVASALIERVGRLMLMVPFVGYKVID